MVGMRMRLMWLGSTGGIPEPLLFVSKINDSGEEVKFIISVSVGGNIHFCCRFLNISEAGKPEFPRFRDFVSKRCHLCFKKVVRLDGCVAFSQIEPKTSNMEWKTQQLRVFRMEFGKVGNVTFPTRKLMVLRGPNPRFSGKSIMCYISKHK